MLIHNTTGESNTAIGGDALVTNTTGSANTALGINVLRNNVDGVFNTGVGVQACFKTMRATTLPLVLTRSLATPQETAM
jgi:hypothetical protein